MQSEHVFQAVLNGFSVDPESTATALQDFPDE